ncbi:MAG: DEAD/DEAH box helicase [Kiritimatiellae bacterium]|nr:DEAD/DEAH box helicase [Kiritimatiellia bacterium]
MPIQTHAAPATASVRPAAATNAFAALLPELQRAVAEEGYVTPTPIQAQAIGHLLAGRDLLGCAQTGTGKTAAFILPILQHLTRHKVQLQRGRPRTLILTPTRELAAQIGDSIRAYGRHLAIRHIVIFGGVGQQPQVAALGRGTDIVVATPGRLLDLMQQRHVRLDGVEVFVLDEADRMLDMGFIHDVRRIIAALPARRQSLFFSATLASEVITLARAMVHDPVHITVTPDQPAVEKISQKVLFVDKKDKPILLVTLLRDPGINKVLVFTQMKHVANRVADVLISAGIRTSVIHGNKSQSARTQAMTGFKAGHVRVLVATDIAARGIDVDGITHVINYDLPNEPHTYVHRIGRTARAGAGGDAVSFCCAEERNYLRDIERLIRKSVPADLKHAYHSETARTATGAAAQPPPRGQRGGQRPHTPHGTRHFSSRNSRFRR